MTPVPTRLFYGSEGLDSFTNADAGVARPIFVPPGDNRSVEPTGNIKVKVSGIDTGGVVAVLEVETSKEFSTPLHVHHVENECFYSIEGEYEVKVGDAIFRLKEGACVYAPRLIPHAIQDISDKGGKLIVVAQPAGHIEAFSVDLFRLTSSGIRDEAAFKAVFLKHNMDVVGPPLPRKNHSMTTP
jgi:mannose-6-phosphate isomerase-like protein (cupin superfamily)